MTFMFGAPTIWRIMMIERIKSYVAALSTVDKSYPNYIRRQRKMEQLFRDNQMSEKWPHYQIHKKYMKRSRYFQL